MYYTERQIRETGNSLKLLSGQQIYERREVVNLLSDTSEVIFGPILGEPLASQLDDILIHQPSPQFEEAALIITSVNFHRRSVHYLRCGIWR